MTTAAKARNEADLGTDADLTADMESEIKNKGFFDKIKTRLREKSEAHGVELPDGCTVSSVAAKFIRERGGEYIGVEFARLAREPDGRGGDGGRWVPYCSKHAGLSTRLTSTEYLLAPMTGADMPAGRQPSSGFLVWRVHNGALQGPLGRTIATSCLQRMDLCGLLSETGRRLLSEQSGTPASEESTVAVTAK